MEVSQEFARRRRSRMMWLAVALLVALALFAIDTGTGGRVTLIGFFAVPPFIVAAGAGRRETAAVVVVCVFLALLAGIIDGFFGSFQHLFRVALGALAGLLAIRVARARERAELVGRLDRDVGRVLAESRDLREATPRLLETVARELGWEAAALWEAEGRDGTLDRVQSWQAPGSRLEDFQQVGGGLTFGTGVGLPGRVLASGAPAWVADVGEESGFARTEAATSAGIRAAAAFPITGTRGVRGVIELFSRKRRRPDASLMQAMSSVGHYIGQHIERRRAEEAVRRGEAVRGAVLESAIDSVITMNHEGRVVEFNPAAERTFGYRRSDAAGRLVREIIVPPHLRDQHQRGLKRYLETGEGPLIGTRTEITAMKADGSEFPVEISITRIGQDDPPMFAAYVRDVTARKAAEQSVRRLAAIVEHSNDAIVATDLRGTIVAWNPAAEALYGWPAGEIIGRHISATAPVDRQNEASFLARQVAEGNAVAGHRTVRMRKDGSLVDVSLTLSPIIGSDEQPVGMAGIIRDITEEKRIEGERIRLLDQEKVARLRAEELEQRAAFIAEAQAALDSSLKFDEVLRRLTRLIVPMFADWCVLHMLEPDGSIRQVAVGHADPEKERLAWELSRRYPPDPDDPQGVPGVLRSGEPQHMREITEALLEQGARDAEHLEIVTGLGLRSAMIVPLRARSQTLGAITFVSAESRRLYGEEDLAFASELGRRAALSIDNARLHSELASRSKELGFLADASAQLDETLDLEETLQKVADLTLQEPVLADGCMVDVLDDTGNVRRVASATTDPDVKPILDQLRKQHIDLDSAHPIAIAMRTGQVQRVDSIDEREQRSWTGDSDHLEAVGSWPGRAAVVAPMRARGRMLGAIAIASFSDRRFGDDDVRVLGELARRAAFAVDNARLYGETNYIAERLQRSLLPPHLPEIHGLEIAARFRPAGDRNEVGGDFYDIFQTGPNRWAITIGDVCGKGPDAAAVTALARHTLRASATRSDDQPDELLRALNDAMLVDNPTDFQFCTVAFASLQIGNGCTRLSVSSGGHPLPVVLRAGGEVESVGEPGTLLGVVPDPVLSCAEVELFRGDTLVFYTDGITEARTPEGLFGYEGLLKAMRRSAGCDAAEIAERIEQTMLDVQSGGLRDDVALVVAQISEGAGAAARDEPALTALKG
ncbi:MAG: PAS domain S-box protein [Solirubrobacterales bacterium]